MPRLAAVVLVLAAIASAPVFSQRRGAAPAPARPARTEHRVPFAAGETLTYDVAWSSYVTAGSAVLAVKEKKPSFNSQAFYIVAEGRPTPLLSKLYSLYYKLDTLLDTYTLLPQRASHYSEEGKRHRFRTTQFDHPARKAHVEHQSDRLAKDDIAISPAAQDPLSAIYVLRAVPFRSGERMTMPICDNGRNYKLQIDISGPEPVATGLGSMKALRLSLKLFDERNQRVDRGTTMWMSDDPRRLPVKLQTELAVGSFNLVLRRVG